VVRNGSKREREREISCCSRNWEWRIKRVALISKSYNGDLGEYKRSKLIDLGD
jgi:hypothetical protein